MLVDRLLPDPCLQKEEGMQQDETAQRFGQLSPLLYCIEKEAETKDSTSNEYIDKSEDHDGSISKVEEEAETKDSTSNEYIDKSEDCDGSISKMFPVDDLRVKASMTLRKAAASGELGVVLAEIQLAQTPFPANDGDASCVEASMSVLEKEAMIEKLREEEEFLQQLLRGQAVGGEFEVNPTDVEVATSGLVNATIEASGFGNAHGNDSIPPISTERPTLTPEVLELQAMVKQSFLDGLSSGRLDSALSKVERKRKNPRKGGS
jgi:hypothetical protein